MGFQTRICRGKSIHLTNINSTIWGGDPGGAGAWLTSLHGHLPKCTHICRPVRRQNPRAEGEPQRPQIDHSLIVDNGPVPLRSDMLSIRIHSHGFWTACISLSTIRLPPWVIPAGWSALRQAPATEPIGVAPACARLNSTGFAGIQCSQPSTAALKSQGPRYSSR